MKRYLKTLEEVIDALQAEKFVRDDEGYIYKMYKGVIFWRKEEQWHVAPTICHDYGLYVDEPEPLKLEVGKFYKTRNGKKAFVFAKITNYSYPFYVATVGELNAHSVNAEGRQTNSEPLPLDLVSPWEE